MGTDGEYVQYGFTGYLYATNTFATSKAGWRFAIVG
jgi:hypothetical protein